MCCRVRVPPHARYGSATIEELVDSDSSDGSDWDDDDVQEAAQEVAALQQRGVRVVREGKGGAATPGGTWEPAGCWGERGPPPALPHPSAAGGHGARRGWAPGLRAPGGVGRSARAQPGEAMQAGTRAFLCPMAASPQGAHQDAGPPTRVSVLSQERQQRNAVRAERRREIIEAAAVAEAESARRKQAVAADTAWVERTRVPIRECSSDSESSSSDSDDEGSVIVLLPSSTARQGQQQKAANGAGESPVMAAEQQQQQREQKQQPVSLPPGALAAAAASEEKEDEELGGARLQGEALSDGATASATPRGADDKGDASGSSTPAPRAAEPPRTPPLRLGGDGAQPGQQQKKTKKKKGKKKSRGGGQQEEQEQQEGASTPDGAAHEDEPQPAAAAVQAPPRPSALAKLEGKALSPAELDRLKRQARKVACIPHQEHKAQQVYRRYLDARPHDADAWHALGEVHSKASWGGASRRRCCFSRPAAYPNALPAPNAWPPACRAQAGEHSDALDCFDRALHELDDSTSSSAQAVKRHYHYSRAAAMRALGRDAEARALEVAVHSMLAPVPTPQSSAAAAGERGSTPDLDAAGERSSTLDLDAAGDPDGRDDPDGSDAAAASRAQRKRGNELYSQHKWEAALGCYEHARTLDQDSKEAHANAAAAFFQLGRWGEAEKAAEQVRAMQRSACRAGRSRRRRGPARAPLPRCLTPPPGPPAAGARD